MGDKVVLIDAVYSVNYNGFPVGYSVKVDSRIFDAQAASNAPFLVKADKAVKEEAPKAEEKEAPVEEKSVKNTKKGSKKSK